MNRSKTQTWHYLAIFSWLGLILISLSWELWIAPLRAHGSWLALKAIPLCLPLAGILKGKIYTFQYSSMLVLIYLAEAIMRLSDANVMSRYCAAIALLLSIIFFVSDLMYIRTTKKHPL